MTIKLAIPKEIAPGEKRVAMDPAVAARLAKAGVQVLVQKGAGAAAQIPDQDYAQAQMVAAAPELYAQADVVFKVAPPSPDEIDAMREGAMVIGFMMAHQHRDMVKRMVARRITGFGIELIPRISRAQSMDALSSQASVAGYKAAIMGADLLNRFFPMLTTAAGTIRPSKALVIGAGVAGLQAIATARRLGAMVEGYDVRPETKEQVESLGAKFLELDVKATGEGGYARELSEGERRQQSEQLARFISAADVLITTAAVPGRPSPKIVTRAMVEGMRPGAVIVDLAAEGGGNCELSKPGKTTKHKGVTVHAPLNVPSQLAYHATEMYAKNLYNFFQPMLHEGAFRLDWEDEILAAAVVTHDGEIKHEPTRKLVEGEQT
jgi:NAD(P) transhydrogenase subunit alpha